MSADEKAVRQDSLPFPPAPSGSIAGRTMQESVYSPRPAPRRLPADAPNILIVLIDDAGPGLPSTLGGEVQTRTLDRVAMGGISLNRFHTTAMCSPTRASILTGRNHHRVGAGQIAELANDWDGYSGQIPKSSALVADVLKDYGYSTAAWGKWHNTPAEETTAAGPSRTGRLAWVSSISTDSWQARRRSMSPTWCWRKTVSPAPSSSTSRR
jgi:arylsulfatase A-like enzyme